MLISVLKKKVSATFCNWPCVVVSARKKFELSPNNCIDLRYLKKSKVQKCGNRTPDKNFSCQLKALQSHHTDLIVPTFGCFGY